MLLMIDNYDSFTFNLVQYFGELGEDVRVFRNDEITLEGISELKPDQLVLSPGPCSPAEAGICVSAIQHFMQAAAGRRSPMRCSRTSRPVASPSSSCCGARSRNASARWWSTCFTVC